MLTTIRTMAAFSWKSNPKITELARLDIIRMSSNLLLRQTLSNTMSYLTPLLQKGLHCIKVNPAIYGAYVLCYAYI